MHYSISPLLLALLVFACSTPAARDAHRVRDQEELIDAIREVTPGAEIILADGTWTDVPINFYGHGTEEAPVTLRAETPGAVFLEGQSSIHLGGEHLVVNGLYFRNGYSPDRGVIRYQIGADSTANYCRVTACGIEGYTRPNRWENDRWIEFYGKHNQLDHCYVAGEANDGVTLMVYHDGNQHTDNYQQIVHNYFGPRLRKGGYDESTIGGYLRLTGTTFTDCGQDEASGVLIQTPGIINVLIAGNTFRDNPLPFVAILWGEKNNHHRDNTLIRSGKIEVEAQRKLELLY